MYTWLCVSLLVPYSLGNHAQLGGGSVAERLRSTLAYGWVERCSNVAGCRRVLHQKISIHDYFISANYIFCLNYDEHVECWKCICLLPLNILRNYASVYACMFGIPVMYHVKFLIFCIDVCPCSWGYFPG